MVSLKCLTPQKNRLHLRQFQPIDLIEQIPETSIGFNAWIKVNNVGATEWVQGESTAYSSGSWKTSSNTGKYQAWKFTG